MVNDAFVNVSLIGFKGAAATGFFTAGAAAFFATGAAFLLAVVAFFVAGAAVFLVAVVAMNASLLVKGCPRPLPLRRHRLTQRYKYSGWAPAYQYRHEDATSEAMNQGVFCMKVKKMVTCTSLHVGWSSKTLT